LRVVAFTAGPLTGTNRILFERLAGDPRLAFEAILVDEYARPAGSLAVRVLRGIRGDGWAWLWFKATTLAASWIRRKAVALFEIVHPRRTSGESYEALEHATGVRVHRVADIHGPESLGFLESLRPQLGVIVGGRILRDSVITIPEYGTLNLHKRKVPEYRGGGPIGYWEILAGERSIGVTIHYATARVDAGPVLAEATIPIEDCDTLESLRIKADLTGARLYHDAIRRVASGDRRGVPQDASRAATYRAPSDCAVWRLERRLKRRAARAFPGLRARPSPLARGRVVAQYAMLLPWLVHLRRRLLARRGAPVCIFFYHVVANRPVNHLCLPLEEFARQIAFLRRYYDVVSLDEAVGRLGSERAGAIVAAITFDDGYRDNRWVIEYLKYFGIPAAFFVSAGHVRDGTPFEHDLRRGFRDAFPMQEAEVRSLAADGFLIGSHGVHHEDFGTLDPAAAERVLRQSHGLIAAMSGRAPEHFSFPRGQRGVNITPASFELAQRHFRYVYSAYGGYNFPGARPGHLRRVAHPGNVLELAMVMDGYTGLRECARGNAWGLRSDALLPY
jgi:peptidoglycan/xylan/chitin deacetylase (PgdA/CDA1 family)